MGNHRKDKPRWRETAWAPLVGAGRPGESLHPPDLNGTPVPSGSRDTQRSPVEAGGPPGHTAPADRTLNAPVVSPRKFVISLRPRLSLLPPSTGPPAAGGSARGGGGGAVPGARASPGWRRLLTHPEPLSAGSGCAGTAGSGKRYRQEDLRDRLAPSGGPLGDSVRPKPRRKTGQTCRGRGRQGERDSGLAAAGHENAENKISARAPRRSAGPCRVSTLAPWLPLPAPPGPGPPDTDERGRFEAEQMPGSPPLGLSHSSAAPGGARPDGAAPSQRGPTAAFSVRGLGAVLPSARALPVGPGRAARLLTEIPGGDGSRRAPAAG